MWGLGVAFRAQAAADLVRGGGPHRQALSLWEVRVLLDTLQPSPCPPIHLTSASFGACQACLMASVPNSSSLGVCLPHTPLMGGVLFKYVYRHKCELHTRLTCSSGFTRTFLAETTPGTSLPLQQNLTHPT